MPANSNTNQAIVKVVRKGGTNSAGQIKRQWEYLSRDGDVQIERSERYQGAVVSHEELQEFAESWAEQTGISGGSEHTQQDLTTHIVVSFPRQTDQASARLAARAWAHEMFGGNNGQDQFDYVSMFHTDKEHPHMHVVVNRRGMDTGDWLKIAQRHPYFNYDIMREKMVQCAAAHGISMEASSRASRGIEDRPLNDADFRRRQRGEPIGLVFDPRVEPDVLGDGSTPRAFRPNRNDGINPLAGASGSGAGSGAASDQHGTIDSGHFDEVAGDEIVPAARGPQSSPTVQPPDMALRSGADLGERHDMAAAEQQEDARAPANARKRRADVPERTMELRSDAAKRARLDVEAQPPSEQENPAGRAAAVPAPSAPSRKRRAEVLERTMELRSDAAKRARAETGMELRSGRTTGQSGQGADPARQNDRSDRSRNR